MSYDLHVWSVRPFEQKYLRKAAEWEQSGDGGCMYARGGWQIVINASDVVLPEDVPEEVAGLLPGIGYLTELNLEGDAPEKAEALLMSTAKEIAKGAHGVIEDPQEDEVITPAGVKRFVPAKKGANFSVLNFSWWFLSDSLGTDAGREAFVGLLEKLLPEALPKRYGLWEPPQHHYEKTGRAHLLKFMAEHLAEMMVWYPQRPVATCSVRHAEPLGASFQGFRTHRVEIEVQKGVLEQPGWPLTLQRLWREMPRLLKPIYGEVRTEGGFSRSGGGAVWIDASMLQEGYPETNRSWFFRGIPRKLGHAVVLGTEYQREWPEFVKQAEMDHGYAFASTENWGSDEDLMTKLGGVPKRIALLPGEGMGKGQEYPEVWPFGAQFK
ncbi:MAG: hypothetical protein ACTHN5_00895 [Phycisphaerae bacterium]